MDRLHSLLILSTSFHWITNNISRFVIIRFQNQGNRFWVTFVILLSIIKSSVFSLFKLNGSSQFNFFSLENYKNDITTDFYSRNEFTYPQFSVGKNSKKSNFHMQISNSGSRWPVSEICHCDPFSPGRIVHYLKTALTNLIERRDNLTPPAG